MRSPTPTCRSSASATTSGRAGPPTARACSPPSGWSAGAGSTGPTPMNSSSRRRSRPSTPCCPGGPMQWRRPPSPAGPPRWSSPHPVPTRASAGSWRASISAPASSWPATTSRSRASTPASPPGRRPPTAWPSSSHDPTFGAPFWSHQSRQMPRNGSQKGAGNVGSAVTSPVISDLSAYVVSGRVVQSPQPTEHESDARTPAQGVQDGVDAERIGFRRVFLSERWNLKQAAVILSAIAARSERSEVGSGIITTPARHPLHMAGMAATFQATFRPRLVLGLGRGNPGWFSGAGLEMPTYRGLADYVDILQRLWRGEPVSYSVSLGQFPHLQLEDVHALQAPPIWFGTLGQPKGAAVAAACFDGVLLPPVFTPEATETIVS